MSRGFAMHMRWMGSLVIVAGVLASLSPALAQSPPPDARSTRTVEIPGTGATVTVPRQWRTGWSRYRFGTGVWTTDLASGRTCLLSPQADPVSADAAADRFVAGLAFMQPYELRERTSLDVPGAHVVTVSFGIPGRDDPGARGAMVYVDAPERVVLVQCGEAPLDHWLEVASGVRPLAADFSAEPFDPRVAMPEHGFAVDFGVEWWVSPPVVSRDAWLGGTTVLRAQVDDDGRCTIEDASAVPGLTGLSSATDPKATIRDARKRMQRSVEPTIKLVQLPSGPAIRADWRSATMRTTAWIVSNDTHVIVLVCSADRPPTDRWRSIARTIELLPTDESRRSLWR